MEVIDYDIDSLGTFEDHWGLHKGCKEWWYATGYFKDTDGNMYSWQFTILNIRLGIVSTRMVMAALTDFQTGQHRYRQKAQFHSRGLTVEKKRVAFYDIASVEKRADGMYIKVNHKDFQLDLKLDYGKGAFWHCDDGKLQMGIPGNKQTTLYYSYTNMPTTGTMTLDGKEVEVIGKSWFDKQGGTLGAKKEICWEWFSLRFYDDEEMMLFTFPITDYQDGTYITKDATRERLQDYTIKPTKFIEKNGMKWSSGWDLEVPGKKDERYTITPLIEGNMNFAYFEELCSIKNPAGDEVGLCFVELLPGIHDDVKLNVSFLFRSVEY